VDSHNGYSAIANNPTGRWVPFFSLAAIGEVHVAPVPSAEAKDKVSDQIKAVNPNWAH
jgi:hypothetical protein